VQLFQTFFTFFEISTVLDPGKGVCADPRRGDATLGVGGPGLPMGDNEHQLSLDRGGEKT
jgi:hypothetical protein